ncbi:MAG: hypothetical protein U9N47_11350, partial [Thermodesulfobacteriota bacterium]|nr:hypothetical protein [Thermodesulfobacteriota bacterium]
MFVKRETLFRLMLLKQHYLLRQFQLSANQGGLDFSYFIGAYRYFLELTIQHKKEKAPTASTK